MILRSSFLATEDFHKVNGVGDIIVDVVDVLLEEVVDLVGYVASVMRYYELLRPAKFVLFIIFILLEPFIEFVQQDLIIASF